MQPMITSAKNGDLGEKKKKEQQELVDAATLKLHAASAAMLKGKKEEDWRLRSVKYTVLFVTRPPFCSCLAITPC
jgi:hypothetical protein